MVLTQPWPRRPQSLRSTACRGRWSGGLSFVRVVGEEVSARHAVYTWSRNRHGLRRHVGIELPVLAATTWLRTSLVAPDIVEVSPARIVARRDYRCNHGHPRLVVLDEGSAASPRPDGDVPMTGPRVVCVGPLSRGGCGAHGGRRCEEFARETPRRGRVGAWPPA